MEAVEELWSCMFSVKSMFPLIHREHMWDSRNQGKRRKEKKKLKLKESMPGTSTGRQVQWERERERERMVQIQKERKKGIISAEHKIAVWCM